MFVLIGWDMLEYQNRPVFYDRGELIVQAFFSKKDAEQNISDNFGRLRNLCVARIDPAWGWKTKVVNN